MPSIRSLLVGVQTPSAARQIWPYAQQLLETFREPENWYESVLEEVEIGDTQRTRKLEISLSHQAKTRRPGDLLFAALTPRKGTLVPIQIVGERVGDGTASFLSHREHEQLARNLLVFRYQALIESLRQNKLELEGPEKENKKRFSKLLSLPSIQDEQIAKNRLSRIFTADGDYKAIPTPALAIDQIRVEATRLYDLAKLLSDRYLKVMKVHLGKGDERVVSYSYVQDIEDRTTRWHVPRFVRGFFRAPSGVVSIHVPWARLTPHYELRMTGIPGYFADRVYASTTNYGKLPKHSGSRRVARLRARVKSSGTKFRGNVTWVATPSGATPEPSLFIGNGRRFTSRLYARIDFRETPPGYTGQALAYHLIGLWIAIGVISWSYFQPPSFVTAIVALVSTLFGLGAGAVDLLIPRAPVFNAPFLPRVFMFFSAVEQLLLGVWVLLRSTETTVRTPPGALAMGKHAEWIAAASSQIDHMLRYDYRVIPWLVLPAMLMQSIFLLTRSIVLANQFSANREPIRELVDN